MKCDGEFKEINVRVMNVISADGMGRTEFRVCTLFAEFESLGKDMCLFQCTCPSDQMCTDVHLTVSTRYDVRICEFKVI